MTIFGISGWDRSGKGVLARALIEAISLGQLDTADRITPTKVIKANCHLFKTPVPVEYFKSAQLVEQMEVIKRQALKGVLIYIDEADDCLGARAWDNLSRTSALTGIWQGGKNDDDLVYTFHATPKGKCKVDKILRVATHIDIEIQDFLHAQDVIVYHQWDWRKKPRHGIFKPTVRLLTSASEWFPKFDTREAIV